METDTRPPVVAVTGSDTGINAAATAGYRWRKYLWLLLGTAVAVLGVHGRWDAAAAAWLYSLFLLRWVRTSGTVVGVTGVVVATTGVGGFWLFESGLPVFGPFLLLLLLVSVVLAVPYLVDRLLADRLAARTALASTLVFPLARVLAEDVVARFSPVGDIYGSLAVTQHDNLPLLQLAALTGGAGITFLLAWFASVGNWVWQQRADWSRIRTVVATYAAILVAVLVGGGVRLALSSPGEATVRLAGVSPTRQSVEHRSAVLDRYPSNKTIADSGSTSLRDAFAAANDDLVRASEREVRAGARIVVWPELGARALAEDAPALLDRVGEVARQGGAYLLVGLGTYHREAPYLRNQAILVDPTGAVRWRYDKAHPVPGWEHYPAGDGRIRSTATPYGRLAAIICYDADFPDLARQGGRDGVDIMLVPSADWLEFGHAHTEKATLRAVENGYALVRQDAPGLARAVDDRGRVIASADYFGMSQQTMIANVPISGTRTIYSRVGDLFGVGCLIGLLALAALTVLTSTRTAEAEYGGCGAMRREGSSP